MHVAIAGWHLRDPNVGIGRYVRGLISALAEREDGHRYTVLLPGRFDALPEAKHVTYRVLRLPVFKRRVWEQLAPLLAGGADVLHLPYDSCIAWKRGALLATVHDVKPLIFGPPPRRRALERWLIPDPWRRIDHVLTDSECSRRDILERLPVGPEQVTVVYPGIDLTVFRPITPDPGPSTPRRPRPYVLSVGGADPTKNVQTLIDAFAALPPTVRAEHDLVLVGDFRRRPELRERVVRLGLEKQTDFTGVVSDRTLIRLYQQAAAFAFPSRYEGFGYPVLEAMACGCPVVSSNASSLPEVTGEAAVLVEPLDVGAWTTQLEGVLTSAALRTDLRRRGLERARRFAWDRAAAQILALYERLAHA